jgi:hypothetical protein
MGRLVERVEHDDVIAAGYEAFDDVTADETGAAGDEHPHHRLRTQRAIATAVAAWTARPAPFTNEGPDTIAGRAVFALRQRAQIVLASDARSAAPEIARGLQTDENQVRRVITEFNADGMVSLRARIGGGRPEEDR